jgi:AcrR family transcriptional regulator
VSSDAPTATNPTHAHILEVAWEQLRNQGKIVSMRDVAHACGISRQAVYLYVGSRAGLLIQMVRHYDEASGVTERFQQALCHRPAVAALEATLRSWFDYVPEILPAARALMAAAYDDADARRALDDRMDAVRSMFRLVITRLESEGQLAPSWKIDRAVEALWSLTHFRAYDDLVVGRGWPPRRFADLQIRQARSLLLPS